MSLSFTKAENAIPIAITSSKVRSMNDKILYLHPHEFKREKSSKVIDIRQIEKELRSLKIKNIPKYVNKIQDALHKNVLPDNFNDIDIESDIYRQIYNKMSDNNAIELDHGTTFNMMPLLPPLQQGKERQTIFIGAQAGSGKSYFIMEYINLYHEAWSKNKIFLISQAKEDSTLDAAKATITNLFLGLLSTKSLSSTL